MRQRNEAELVKKYFHYLFSEYGFTIIDVKYFEDFSNWVAVLTSDKYRLRFLEDRGTVTLAIGPLWDPPGWDAGPWFDLSFVIAYLNQEPFAWDYDVLAPAEPQIERLSHVLRPYMDQICTVFSPDAFPEHHDELRRLWDKWYRDFLNYPAKRL